MVWLAVHKNGREGIFYNKPERYTEYWADEPVELEKRKSGRQYNRIRKSKGRGNKTPLLFIFFINSKPKSKS